MYDCLEYLLILLIFSKMPESVKTQAQWPSVLGHHNIFMMVWTLALPLMEKWPFQMMEGR